MKKQILIFILIVMTFNLFATSNTDIAKEIILDNQHKLQNSNRIDIRQTIDVAGSIRNEEIIDFFSKINSFDNYGSATIMPFFDKKDEFIVLSDSSNIVDIRIKSSNENVNKYFADIILSIDIKLKRILKMKAITIIYGVSKEGSYSYTENCLIEYFENNGFFLPKTIKYYINKDDESTPKIVVMLHSATNESNPRLLTKLNYIFNKLSEEDIQLKNEIAIQLLESFGMKEYSNAFWEKQIEDSKYYDHPNIPDSVWVIVKNKMDEKNTFLNAMSEIYSDEFKIEELQELLSLFQNENFSKYLELEAKLTSLSEEHAFEQMTKAFSEDDFIEIQNILSNKTFMKFNDFQVKSGDIFGRKAMELGREIPRRISIFLNEQGYLEK